MGPPRLQHAGEPVDGRVDIAVAHGFVQRGNEVVVFFAVFVVQQGFLGNALFSVCSVTVMPSGPLSPFRTTISSVPSAVRASPIGKGGQRGDHCIGHVDVLRAKAARIRERTAQQRCNVLRREWLQHKDLAAREQGGVDLKRGVFRRGADQDDAAALHKRQKSVLLCLVETVNLVH